MFLPFKTERSGPSILPRMIIRIRRAAALFLSLGSIAVAATPAAWADDPSVAPILAAMRQASGGDRWADVRTLHVTTMTQSGGMVAHGEEWDDVAAGRYRARNSWPGFTTQHGFDGITPWRQGRSGIAYAVGDTDALRASANASYRLAQGWWFPQSHPATIAWAGTGTRNGEPCDILDVTPEGGRPFKVWISRPSHLLLRVEEQQAEERSVVTYSDYRPVHGVLLPFTSREGDGVHPEYDDVETVQSVDFNPAVADSLYAIPPRSPSNVVFPAHETSVEVPFRLTDDHRILVPLTLNGHRQVEAEFDSGGGLIIQPATVAALKLAATGQSKVSGGGEGSTTARNGTLQMVSIGPVTVRRLAYHSFPFAADEPDRALMGLEILQRFVVHLDFDRQVMTLTRPDVFHDQGRGIVIPFHIQDNQPEITGSIDGISGHFAIDTGDSGSLLLIAPFARRYGLARRYQADIPYNGTAVSATHGAFARRRVHTVAFDGPDGRPAVEAHDPVTRISFQQTGFDANRYVSANIGLGILRQFNLTFDYDRRILILEPNASYGKKDVFNRVGLRLQRQGTAWRVTSVYSGSPAGDAGLHVGDIVLRIDGHAPDALPHEALWGRLEGALGSHVTLTLPSGPHTRDVVLTLRDIL
jgi:Aspartyl protease/PDZ domain